MDAPSSGGSVTSLHVEGAPLFAVQAWLDEHRTCCLKKLFPPSATFTIRRLHLEATDG